MPVSSRSSRAAASARLSPGGAPPPRSAAPLGVGAAAWRQTLNDSYAERATGRLGDLPATFRELARRNGIMPDDRALAAACAARLAAQRELFVFRPDALAVLAKVRSSGLRVGVLSDCTIERPRPGRSCQWPIW